MSASSSSGAEESRLLVEAVRGFAEKHPGDPDGAFDAAAWRELQELGFATVGASEAIGGSGGSMGDALAVSEVLAHHGVALPAGDHAVVAGFLCEQAGWVLDDGFDAAVLGAAAPTVRREGGAVLLDGTAEAVPWARHADRLLVLARSGDEHVLCRVDPRRSRIEEGANLAGEPRDRVVFDGVVVDGAVGISRASADEVLRHGALVRSAQLVGAMGRVLELTVGHVTGRQQFGRPLAAFQAVRHAVAVLAGDVAVASAAVAAAGRCGGGANEEVAVVAAKLRTAEAATRVARLAHELHGAIGTTEEHDLGRYTRRLWAWRDEYGTERQWALRLGRMAMAHGDLWSTLTGVDQERPR